jgi:hypothetical protein
VRGEGDGGASRHGAGGERLEEGRRLEADERVQSATRVHIEGGPHPVWNEDMAFTLGEDVLLHPHPAITIKV